MLKIDSLCVAGKNRAKVIRPFTPGKVALAGSTQQKANSTVISHLRNLHCTTLIGVHLASRFAVPQRTMLPLSVGPLPLALHDENAETGKIRGVPEFMWRRL